MASSDETKKTDNDLMELSDSEAREHSIQSQARVATDTANDPSPQQRPTPLSRDLMTTSTYEPTAPAPDLSTPRVTDPDGLPFGDLHISPQEHKPQSDIDRKSINPVGQGNSSEKYERENEWEAYRDRRESEHERFQRMRAEILEEIEGKIERERRGKEEAERERAERHEAAWARRVAELEARTRAIMGNWRPRSEEDEEEDDE